MSFVDPFEFKVNFLYWILFRDVNIHLFTLIKLYYVTIVKT